MANGAKRIAEQRTARKKLEQKYPWLATRISWGNGAAADWCREHCQGKWTLTWEGYRFELEQDRVAFVLVWG
jgi:hypothetical protein